MARGTVERSLFLLCAMAGRDAEAREYGRRSALVLDDLGYSFPRGFRGSPPRRTDSSATQPGPSKS